MTLANLALKVVTLGTPLALALLVDTTIALGLALIYSGFIYWWQRELRIESEHQAAKKIVALLAENRSLRRQALARSQANAQAVADYPANPQQA